MSIVLEAAEMALHMYLVYLEQRFVGADIAELDRDGDRKACERK